MKTITTLVFLQYFLRTCIAPSIAGKLLLRIDFFTRRVRKKIKTNVRRRITYAADGTVACDVTQV